MAKKQMSAWDIAEAFFLPRASPQYRQRAQMRKAARRQQKATSAQKQRAFDAAISKVLQAVAVDIEVEE